MENNSEEIIHIVTEQYLFIYNFACKLTNDRDSALDFTQDAFIKAVTKTDTFRDAPTVNNVRAWLITIVKRTIIDSVRKKSNKPPIIGLKPYHKIIEPPQLDRYAIEDLNNAINKLHPTYKELIIHLLNGYHYEELSLKFSIPIGTVKNKLFRAKMLLKKHMTQLGYDKYYTPAKRSNIATENNKQKRSSGEQYPDDLNLTSTGEL